MTGAGLNSCPIEERHGSVSYLDSDTEGYIDYLAKRLSLVRHGGLILAHNMRRPPDPRYIEAITTTDPDLDTMLVFMEGAGIGVTLRKRSMD